MPENEHAIGGPEQAVAEARETIRNGLRMVSNVVHARQTEMGYWPPEDGGNVDYRIFFAELYSKVTSAYETYKEERDPTHLIWIDPKTGEEVAPGTGVPQGLAIDLVDIIFDVLGFATNVGINISHLAADVAVSMRAAPVDVEGDDDDEEFDLEEILGTSAPEPQAAAVEILEEQAKPDVAPEST
jgi:hypothetical protein